MLKVTIMDEVFNLTKPYIYLNADARLASYNTVIRDAAIVVTYDMS